MYGAIHRLRTQTIQCEKSPDLNYLKDGFRKERGYQYNENFPQYFSIHGKTADSLNPVTLGNTGSGSYLQSRDRGGVCFRASVTCASNSHIHTYICTTTTSHSALTCFRQDLSVFFRLKILPSGLSENCKNYHRAQVHAYSFKIIA